MEHTRNVFKWSMLIAVLFLMPQVSHAAGKTVDSTQCLSSPIYDLTGTYENSIFDSSDFPITVFQDGKGKLSGDGNSSCTTNIDLGDDGFREVYLDFTYVVKGAIKSNQQFSLAIKLKGTAYVDGLGDSPFSASKSVKGQITTSQSGPVMSGQGKAKGCIKKIGCDSEHIYLDEPLDDPENGTWTLTFDADKGEGELKLLYNDERSFPFAVKGKQNIRKGESTFSLKGIDASKGCSLNAKFDENGNSLISLKGKVLGQKINCQ